MEYSQRDFTAAWSSSRTTGWPAMPPTPVNQLLTVHHGPAQSGPLVQAQGAEKACIAAERPCLW